jgi:hypothetical protein
MEAAPLRTRAEDGWDAAVLGGPLGGPRSRPRNEPCVDLVRHKCGRASRYFDRFWKVARVNFRELNAPRQTRARKHLWHALGAELVFIGVHLDTCVLEGVYPDILLFYLSTMIIRSKPAQDQPSGTCGNYRELAGTTDHDLLMLRYPKPLPYPHPLESRLLKINHLWTLTPNFRR